MTSASSSNLYTSKDANYFSNARKDIAPLLKRLPNSRALEIGCSGGQTLEWLKSEGYCGWVGGVEPFAPTPSSKLIDQFWRLDIEKQLPDIPEKSIDLLLCLDVLEHLRDPWTALRDLSKLIKDDGQIIISLPNIRNYRTVFRLFLNGDFYYTDDGILDRTHLRFFTRQSATQLIEQAGVNIDKIITPDINRGGKKALARMGLTDILAKQFIFSARKK